MLKKEQAHSSIGRQSTACCSIQGKQRWWSATKRWIDAQSLGCLNLIKIIDWVCMRGKIIPGFYLLLKNGVIVWICKSEKRTF